MGIGADIAAVRNELGTTVTIVRTGLTEKIDSSLRDPARDPFTEAHHFDANFSYNTAIIPGDVLIDSGEYYLVMDRSSDDFEDEVVEYASILFKCNLPSTAKIVTPTEIKDLDTFKVTQGWTVKQLKVYGLIYKKQRGTTVNANAVAGQDLTFTLECLVPADYNIARLDRLVVNATDYFRVEDVEKYQYPNIYVATLVKDDRSVYTP